MVKIPEALWEPINKAYPQNVCIVCTVQPDGYAQASPRGSVVIMNGGSALGFWNRGGGTTADNLEDGSKVTVYFRDPAMRESGVLKVSGIARFYGTATVHREGDVLETVWETMVQPERDRDPDKKGHAVLVELERAETLTHQPLE